MSRARRSCPCRCARGPRRGSPCGSPRRSGLCDREARRRSRRAAPRRARARRTRDCRARRGSPGGDPAAPGGRSASDARGRPRGGEEAWSTNGPPVRKRPSARSRRAPSIPWARSGGALQPVVDRLAEAVFRDRRDRDHRSAASVELGEKGEEVCCRFHKIAGRAEVSRRRRRRPRP